MSRSQNIVADIVENDFGEQVESWPGAIEVSRLVTFLGPWQIDLLEKFTFRSNIEDAIMPVYYWWWLNRFHQNIIIDIYRQGSRDRAPQSFMDRMHEVSMMLMRKTAMLPDLSEEEDTDRPEYTPIQEDDILTIGDPSCVLTSGLLTDLNGKFYDCQLEPIEFGGLPSLFGPTLGNQEIFKQHPNRYINQNLIRNIYGFINNYAMGLFLYSKDVCDESGYLVEFVDKFESTMHRNDAVCSLDYIGPGQQAFINSWRLQLKEKQNG